jgi:NitT/TauT family transport system permease protein
VALIPLIILWLGLGSAAKFVIVFILTVFPVLINTFAGVRNVSQSLVDVGVAFVASERQIFTKIILPAALPYIMAGLRLGIGRAIIGMVVAEFFTALRGLGAMIVKYGNFFRTDSMLVPVIVLMFMGVLLTAALKRAEETIAPWKETERAQ